MTEFEPGSATDLSVPPPPSPPPTRRRSRRAVGMTAVGAFALTAGVVVGVQQATRSPRVPAPASTAQGTSLPATFLPRYGRDAVGGLPNQAGTGSATDSTATATTTAATAAQRVGIVEISTVLTYQNAQAAGTGMILTSTGEILTNNHVVQGATRISVTISGTGVTYSATVVGTDPAGDVAVLQLAGASGLQTARISPAPPTAAEAVTGVGNAGGTGSLTAASGTITGLDQSITASEETGGNAEQLTGLIETDAPIQPGDSGGPLYGADGTVIGIDTAASSGGAVRGYAIPIATAEGIAAQIESGVDNATIHQGYPAFLGVALQNGGAAVTVAGTLSGGPAARAGIAAGDVIASVGGSPVTSAATLSSVMAGHHPGDLVRVTWTTATGATRSATVTLMTGPAD